MSDQTEHEHPAPHAVAPCADGTVASYAGTTCAQPDVVYHFPPLDGFFESWGSVPIKPEEVIIQMDREGPSTLLIRSDKFTLTEPGQDFAVCLTFMIDGSSAYDGWINDPAVTQDARIEAETVIRADPDVRSAVSHENPTSPAQYDPGNYRVELTLIGRSHQGACTFRSFGTHFGVL